MRELKILSGQANPQLAHDICEALHLQLGSVSLGKFPMGKTIARSTMTCGRDVFLIQPTCPPVNDNLLELLIMIDSCKASAARARRYLLRLRQDAGRGRVPLPPSWLPQINAPGPDRVLTMDLHARRSKVFRHRGPFVPRRYSTAR